MIALAQHLTQRTYSWTAWKAIQASKILLTQYDDDGVQYTVYGYDGPEVHLCTIWKGEVPHGIVGSYSQAQNDADKADFEANYKASANATIEPRAKDGRPTIRTSYANRTTNFKLRPITFYTSTPGSIHNVNPVTDADYGDATMALYKKVDGAWVAATDPAEATKTVVDIEPHYNFEIIGGFVDIPSALGGGTTDAWYLSAIGVPDYGAGAPFYGSVDFVPEVNLEAVRTGRVISDGRAISYLAYNYYGYPHTNKIRFIVKHPAGEAKRFQIYLEHFV
jgi:hypothetical protein